MNQTGAGTIVFLHDKADFLFQHNGFLFLANVAAENKNIQMMSTSMVLKNQNFIIT